MNRRMRLLLVEDDPEDVELTREVLRRCGLNVRLAVVADGAEALDYLRMDPNDSDAVRPDLILLDLNMPRMDGLELLKRIQASAPLKSIPVVVLTTSSAEEDRRKCDELGAKGFVTKPVGVEQFDEAAEKLESLCAHLAAMPNGG